MANRGTHIGGGDSLDVGDYLVSKNGKFFAILLADGRFCVFRGKGPEDAQPGRLLWQSQATPPGGTIFYVYLQPDAELRVYHGSGGGNQVMVWSSGQAVPNGNGGMLIMQDDGNLAVYYGVTPENPGPYVWGCGAAPVGARYCRVTNDSGIGVEFCVAFVNPGDPTTYRTGWAGMGPHSSNEIDLANYLAWEAPPGSTKITPAALCWIAWASRGKAGRSSERESGASFVPATVDDDPPYVAIIHTYVDASLTVTNSASFSVIPY